ncbi:hypothetical protein E2C01_071507 [Portunus trituberculatus]|uniref:Uncharacterized protein n=1 Tax=Portunus trituberculatus TaxID=210409 RepID=A0A5B7I8D8_PORTR|nr:hypothetical protein [Portunus trituberculatus]
MSIGGRSGTGETPGGLTHVTPLTGLPKNTTFGLGQFGGQLLEEEEEEERGEIGGGRFDTRDF